MNKKKETILASAEQLIAQFGFRKTTMEEIATVARMAKSTIYYYFKSKDEIFSEIIRKDSNEFRKKLIEAISETDTSQEKILHYVEARMQHLKELSIYFTTLNDEFLDHYFFVEEARKNFYEFEKRMLNTMLEEGVYQNCFQINDIDVATKMISNAIKGLEYSLLVRDSENDIEIESEQMMKIIFEGINK